MSGASRAASSLTSKSVERSVRRLPSTSEGSTAGEEWELLLIGRRTAIPKHRCAVDIA